MRPQTNVHPGFKRGKETQSVIWSERTMSFHSEPHSAEAVTDTVCGGKTYTVTQIQFFFKKNLYESLSQVA